MNYKNIPVLYSFRRCPYAMRARFAILVSGRVCEIREVKLSEKPAEMVNISPKATVPVLEFSNGNVLEESMDIMLWALGLNDPYDWCNPRQGDMEEVNALINKNDTQFKYDLDRYKYPSRFNNVDPVLHRARGKKYLDELNERLSSSSYLFGSKPCLADYSIVPFIRQFANTNIDWFNSIPHLDLQVWMQKILSSNLFADSMVKYPIWKLGDSPRWFGPRSVDHK
ncbi:MAG: glutathione S-transferase [Pseudomonadota bacterium]|nr:glutathione S-transferase [Pseudomonadota bacterium]